MVRETRIGYECVKLMLGGGAVALLSTMAMYSSDTHIFYLARIPEFRNFSNSSSGEFSLIYDHNLDVRISGPGTRCIVSRTSHGFRGRLLPPRLLSLVLVSLPPAVLGWRSGHEGK